MIKKEVLTLVIVLLAMVLAHFARADDVGTSLKVGEGNAPPSLLKFIPNQTWLMNTNLTNAFDLDDYFIDNETLTYNSSDVENITVVINSTTNEVSFYPDYGFTGLRNVTFYASDGILTTPSNVVFLNVTRDNEPPQWSNMQKDKADSDIYQNTIVNFSTDWTDNLGLDYFIFSINQGGGWANQSQVSFSGKQNTSRYSIKISAPGGTVVYWQFFGFDEAGNMNATDVKNFTVNETQAGGGAAGGGGGGGTGAGTGAAGQGGGGGEGGAAGGAAGFVPFTRKQEESKQFNVEPSDSFKIDLKQGGSGVITVKITNTGNTNLTFNIDILGLKEFGITISDENFTLESGESKAVTIEFRANESLAPELYFGKLVIKSEAGEKEIPIVIEVKPLELDFDVLVSLAEEKEFKPGQEVRANITLVNLKELKERKVKLYYALMDFYGTILASSEEDVDFNTQRLSLSRALTLPNEIEKGEYIFFARAVSGDEVNIDSAVFRVGERFSVWGFVKANLILLLIILAAIFVAVLMINYHYSKERVRLLNLYLMITEMKTLMEQGKLDEAIDIYVRIKSTYGEPVSRTTLQNREEIKRQMELLAEKAGEIEKKLSEKEKKQIEEKRQSVKGASESKSEVEQEGEDGEKEAPDTGNGGEGGKEEASESSSKQKSEEEKKVGEGEKLDGEGSKSKESESKSEENEGKASSDEKVSKTHEKEVKGGKKEGKTK